MLFRKYEPNSISELIGNKKQALEILERVKKGENFVVAGPPGTGKTTAMKIVARQLNYQLVDANSSQRMRWEEIMQAARQQPFFHKGKIILVDDYETFIYKSRVKELLEQSKFPVVLVCNNLFEAGLYYMNLPVIKFNAIRKDVLLSYLRKVANAEGIKANERDLKIIAELANGDVRFALNSLESLSQGYRDRVVDVFRSLNIIMNSKSLFAVSAAIESSDKDPDEMLRWIAYAIVVKAKDENAISRAFEHLSRYDIVRRASGPKTMASFVFLATRIEKKHGFAKYEVPKRKVVQEIEFPHMSRRKATADMLLRRLLSLPQ